MFQCLLRYRCPITTSLVLFVFVFYSQRTPFHPSPSYDEVEEFMLVIVLLYLLRKTPPLELYHDSWCLCGEHILERQLF